MAQRQDVTPAQLDKCVTALRSGAPIWLACKFAGFSPDVLDRLKANDPSIQSRIEQAEAEAAMFFIGNLRKHAAEDPKVSMFWLERRMRNEFGHKIEVDQTKRVFTISMGNPKTLEQEDTALPQHSQDAEFTEVEE